MNRTIAQLLFMANLTIARGAPQKDELAADVACPAETLQPSYANAREELRSSE
jgi:hypothetical protein